MSAVYVILIICMCRISFGAAQAYVSDQAEDVNSVSIWTVTSLSLDDHRYSCEPRALLSEVFPSSPPVGPVTDLLYPANLSVTNCLKRYLCWIGCESNAIWYMSFRTRNNQQMQCVYSFVVEKQWKSAGRKICFMTETFQFFLPYYERLINYIILFWMPFFTCFPTIEAFSLLTILAVCH